MISKLVLFVVFLAVLDSASAQCINLDIGRLNAEASVGYGAAHAQPGCWNRMLVTGGGPMNGLSGTPSGVSVSASAAHHFTFAFDNPNTFGDDELLLDGGHDGAITLDFAGLQNGDYYVTTYAFAADNPVNYRTLVAVTGSQTEAQIVGGADWTGVHVQGVTFARHVVSVTDGALQIVCTVSNLYATVNGVQLEPVPGAPASYCVAKVNSLGCTPTIYSVGAPSAAASSGFRVESARNRNERPGLLLYTMHGRNSQPFLGGTLCVNAPLRRSNPMQSGGTPQPVADCTGIFSLDMNAFARGAAGGNPDVFLVIPGTLVDCQFWGRDPSTGNANNKSLSPGLEYLVMP